MLMTLCAIPQMKNFTFLGWYPFHTIFASVGFIASTFCPMFIIKNFVENILSTLGSQVNESTSFDNNTWASQRLNLAHFVASPLSSYQASSLRICWQHSKFLWPWLFGYERVCTKVDIARLAWHFQSTSQSIMMWWWIRLMMRF